MRKNKYRIYYALLLVFLLVCSFWSANPLLLVCAGIWVLVPFILKLMLTYSAPHVQVRCELRSAGRSGQDNCVTFLVKNDRFLVGVLFLRVRYTNPMFGLEVEEEYRLTSANGRTQFAPFMLRDMCGKVNVECVEIEYGDLLGLCRTPLPAFAPESIVIFPERMALNFQNSTEKMGRTLGDQVFLNQKGKDPGEVYALRDYIPGDDTRSIHWKLFGKTDELIVRENSEPTHTRHALLFDVPFPTDGEISTALATDAFGVAAALGSQFIRQNIPHQAIYTTHNRLYTAPINSQQEQYERLQTWLELPLPKEPGTGLDLFVAEGIVRHFARIFYVTAGSIPENPLLSGSRDVTVICLVEQGERVQVDTRDHCRLMIVPIACLHENNFNLPI